MSARGYCGSDWKLLDLGLPFSDGKLNILHDWEIFARILDTGGRIEMGECIQVQA